MAQNIINMLKDIHQKNKPQGIVLKESEPIQNNSIKEEDFSQYRFMNSQQRARLLVEITEVNQIEDSLHSR